MRHIHALTRWHIRRHFAGRHEPRLFEQLRRCPSCAALYARHSKLESALWGDPSALAIDRVEKALFDRLSGPENPRRWSRAGLALASACAIALVVVFARPVPERVAIGQQMALAGVTARGELAPRSSNVGIRVFRVNRARVSEPRDLSLSDIVTFTWTDVDPELRYLTIFGLQQDGRVRWYYSNLKLSGLHVDEPLGDGIRLSVRHKPGWLRLIALFSKENLPQSEIEAVVSRATGHIGELERLPFGKDVLEHSVRVDIASP